MTTADPPVPAPFTNEDFAARMSRVVSSAAEKVSPESLLRLAGPWCACLESAATA